LGSNFHFRTEILKHVLTTNRIKDIKSLQLAKFRKELGQFVIEGEKNVRELLQAQPYSSVVCEEVFAETVWLRKNRDTLPRSTHKYITEVTSRQLEVLSALTTPPPIIAVAAIPEEKIDFDPDNELVIYLDQIQDPGNAGTIMRLADWFGIRWVFASPDSADLWAPKVVQAGMGAFLRVKTARIDLIGLIDRSMPVLAADMTGQSVYSGNMPKNGVLLLGNEGQGISVSNERLITERITIPRTPRGGAESLNVATAAAIILSHMSK
jgi:RNA methyltransferase, TrmH family